MIKDSKATGQKKKPEWLPGDPKPDELIASIIRVDHAGEYGAKRIYLGQIAAMKNHNKIGVIKHMLDQEQKHLDYFEEQIKKRHIRPTVLLPVWHVCGYWLGYITGIMGYKAAMACTVAVENEIEQHYANQLQVLANNKEHKTLREAIDIFRTEELEHHDTGLLHGAGQTFGYRALYATIGWISRMAIRISTRW